MSIFDYASRFLGPVLLGNIVGGTALVAMINHAQVREEIAFAKINERSDTEQ